MCTLYHVHKCYIIHMHNDSHVHKLTCTMIHMYNDSHLYQSSINIASVHMDTQNHWYSFRVVCLLLLWATLMIFCVKNNIDNLLVWTYKLWNQSKEFFFANQKHLGHKQNKTKRQRPMLQKIRTFASSGLHN